MEWLNDELPDKSLVWDRDGNSVSVGESTTRYEAYSSGCTITERKE